MSPLHLMWSLRLTMSWIMHGPLEVVPRNKRAQMMTCINIWAQLCSYTFWTVYLHAFGWLRQFVSGKCSSWDVPAELVRRESKASTNFLAESLLQNRSYQNGRCTKFTRIQQSEGKMSSKWLTKGFSRCNDMKQTETRMTEMAKAAKEAKTAKAVQWTDLFLDLGFRLFIQFHRLALFVLKLVLRGTRLSCHPAHHTYIHAGMGNDAAFKRRSSLRGKPIGLMATTAFSSPSMGTTALHVRTFHK